MKNEQRKLRGFRDLRVYQLAYRLAMEVFARSKAFPTEERYSLTDQIRRSSRSVAANIAEGFRKRQYPRMFINFNLPALRSEFQSVAEKVVENLLEPAGISVDLLKLRENGVLEDNLSSRARIW